MLWSSLSSLLSLVSCLLTNLCALKKIQQENSYMYVCMHKGGKKNKTKQNKRKRSKELILKKDLELPSSSKIPKNKSLFIL